MSIHSVTTLQASQHCTADLLILGGGMAAAQLVKRLDQYGYEGSIVLVSEERVVGYNRVLLPHYLGQEVTAADLAQTALGETAALMLTQRLGVKATKLVPDRQVAHLDDGTTVRYGSLVFALGSNAVIPNGIDASLPRVSILRAWEDADRLESLVAPKSSMLVVGGGLLGLEAADALLGLGCSITLVHRSSRLMTKQIDAQSAGLLARRLTQKGIRIMLDEEVQLCRDSKAGVEVVFRSKPKQVHSFQAVVISAGCAPRTVLAEAAKIPCSRGIEVDSGMRSTVANVFALGECAEVAGTNYQLVEPIFRQADVLAQNLCGGQAELDDVVQGSHLKIEDAPLFFAGTVPPDPGENDAVLSDSQSTVYRRLCIEGDVLRGAVLFGDTAGAREIQQHINLAISPTQIQQLIFGLKAA